MSSGFFYMFVGVTSEIYSYVQNPMAKLFEPFKIKSVTLKNRIVISPMCQYSAKDGFANDWHLVHLGSRAVGGAGLIIQEATSVSPEGRISPDDLGLWSDDHIAKLKDIADFIHSQNAHFGVQLAHAGRKASHASPWKGSKQLNESEGGWTTVGPSAIAFGENETAPEELTLDGIKKVVDDFRSAAIRAHKAGYDVIEIHAAHGYLIHQFLSPLCNTRNDNYGGSFENRTRLLLEVIHAVQQVWPREKPIFVRISATDWAEGGWDVDDSIALSRLLKESNIDVIDCSSGGAVRHQKITLGPGYQVPFAERVRRDASISTAAVGLITEAEQAEQILSEGKADLILIARESLRDPHFPLHAAHVLGEEITWPLQYERAKPRK